MVVTVRGASQVPVCSGWLTVLLSPSELHGKPECQSQISALPADMQQRYLRSSGCLMCPPCRTCLRCSGLKWSWPTSRLCWKWFAAWLPVVSLPAPPLHPSPSFIASPLIIRKLAWQTFSFSQTLTRTDCLLPAMIDFPTPDLLWSSAAPGRDTPPLALCTGLNQSGSWWTRLRLSQMLISAQLSWELRGTLHVCGAK